MAPFLHRTLVKGLLLAAAPFSLVGCQTAPVALNQANHTVQLMSMLDEQLTQFRQVQEAATQARVDSLNDQKSALLLVDDSSALNVQAAKSAGDTTREPFAQKLLSDADGLAKQKSRSLDQQASYATKLESLLTPIPSTKASIAQAQTKAALMGRELDSETRFAELQLFLTELGENIKANRKQIDDAKAAAAKADSANKAATGVSTPAAPVK